MATDVSVVVVPVLVCLCVGTHGKTVEARDTEVDMFGVPEEIGAIQLTVSVPNVLAVCTVCLQRAGQYVAP